jgi:hypothetical protein
MIDRVGLGWATSTGLIMIETQCREACSGEHVVTFYDRESELAQTVGSYLADAIDAGGSGIMIATETHRRAFEAELQRAGIDAAQAFADKALWSLDAAQTLAGLMPSGHIDAQAFRREVGSIIRGAARAGRPVRAFGEMVALLWDAGDVLGAIELEELWTQLGSELPFSDSPPRATHHGLRAP